MKKFSAICLLLILLVSAAHLGELVKLPVLAKHYAQHKKEDRNMNLLKFLTIHYLNCDVAYEDYNEDMKLPFKTLLCSASAMPVFEPAPIFQTAAPHEQPYSKPKSSRYLATPLNTIAASIFQPPKACPA